MDGATVARGDGFHATNRGTRSPSATVNPAAAPTVDFTASTADPDSRMMIAVAGSTPSVSRVRQPSRSGGVERVTIVRPSAVYHELSGGGK
jgi:hypothetical protein